MVISVDASDEDRLGECVRIFHEAKVRLVIDHHVTNNRFAITIILTTERRPVAERLFMPSFADWGVELDREMAQALYIAISTDTGRLALQLYVAPDVAGDGGFKRSRGWT